MDRDLSPDGDGLWAAFNFEAFKGVIIEIHLMTPGGNLSPIIGIIDDEVGITAGLDRALSREKSKELCGIGAGGGDELMQVNSAGLYSVGVEQVNSIFERGDAVWNLGEVIATHDFLGGKIKRRMIGREGGNEAVAECVPKDILVLLIAQRRRHDGLGAFEIGFLGLGSIEEEILNQGFNPDMHALFRAPDRFAQGFFATQVDDVDMSAGHFRESHEMMYALRFDYRWPAPVMPFRAGLAFGEEFLLQCRNEISVFAVRGGDYA